MSRSFKTLLSAIMGTGAVLAFVATPSARAEDEGPYCCDVGGQLGCWVGSQGKCYGLGECHPVTGGLRCDYSTEPEPGICAWVEDSACNKNQ